MKTIMEVITQRRSIRRYLQDKVPQEVLDDILEAVRWSPSWANTQCWEIIVVKEQHVKEELQAVLSAKNPATVAFITLTLRKFALYVATTPYCTMLSQSMVMFSRVEPS